MTRAEKVAEAQRLRAEGLTYREIGERMGASHKTAHAWISDPDLAKLRARKASYAAACLDCGGPTDGSGGRAVTRTRCASCAARHVHESRYWTPERIVQAMRAWAEEFGRPPTATEWLYDRPDGVPSVPAVQREFGSWNAAIEAAGFSPRAPGTYGRDGEDMGLCREIRERYEAGESPHVLAAEYECDIGTIAYRVVKAGGRRRSRSEARRLDWERRRLTA